MNLPRTQIDALQALGYTEEEARFLYLVATHSGYFLARQFLGFTGAWGKRTMPFRNKLPAARHTRTHRFAKGVAAYHLFSRKVYREIGRENLGNRREHALEYLRTRIAMLDFVLGNLDLDYLETESDKVAYFCTERKLSKQHLPSKTYTGRHAVPPTVRYFVDRYPMFFAPSSSSSRTVTLTYIQDTEANLTGFVRHLEMYLPLFCGLSEFRFLFLARTDAHFAKASELFRDLVTIPLSSNPAEDLLRYFAIRKAWDSAKYTSLTEADLIFRNLAKERFGGARFEHLYHAWKVGLVADAEIRGDLGGSDEPHIVQFDTQTLRAIGPSDGETEENR